MTIDLIADWHPKYRLGQAELYAAGRGDKKIIDKTLNKLHEQGQLYWTKMAASFSFPVIFIYKNSNGVRKGRPVIDIRALNHITFQTRSRFQPNGRLLLPFMDVNISLLKIVHHSFTS